MPRAGLTPEGVLDAAERIADADGFDAVTLARLAAALSVRPPSLYKHVENLEAVRRGLALRGIAEANRRLQLAPIGKARATADRLTAPHQTFVEVPFSPHGVAFESPVKTPGQVTCGAQMMKGFIADPTAAPDTSCLGDLVPVQFTSEPAEVRQYFGTTDPWE